MILLFCSIQGIVFQLDMYRSSILFCEIGMPVVTHFIIISYSVCTGKSLSVLSQVLMVYMLGQTFTDTSESPTCSQSKVCISRAFSD